MEDKKTFMGYKLADDGTVEGAYPVLEQKISDVMKQMQDNTEKYVIEQCVELKIDPDILKKQLAEIRRLQLELLQKEQELKEGREKWKYFEARFVKTTYKHDEEEKLAYIIFPEGEETQFVDLEALIDKGLENAKERGEIK